VTSNSKYFDSIRIAPRKAKGLEEAPHLRETAKAKSSAPECEWEGCREPGLNRAPRGTSPDGLNGKVEKPYRLFCAKHVREFNHNYDFFQGMSDKDIAAFQRDALTGHRPTWGLGVNAASTPGGDRVGGRIPKGKKSLFYDTYGFFDESGPNGPAAPARRAPRTLERQALDTLGLEETASLNQIKSRYKELVKRHHPDANGGDRSAEERLRKVIQAYDYLRKSGFC
jgi:curved DNA-binding protein CbpA